MIDETIDRLEGQVGCWNPSNKFMHLYIQLDDLCDKVSTLNYSTMDAIGIRAKELKKTMDEIISNLNKLNDTNYDKNKIDYLFEMLEKSIESQQYIEVLADRLKAIERIHKESPNFEQSINSLIERQGLIESSFKVED